MCLERLALALALDVAADLACDGDGTADEPPSDPAERWRVVHRGYVARFGPEASAIGPPREWEATHGPVDG